MENIVETYTSKEFGSVRTVTKDGKTYFVGNDVAKALGYSETAKAIRTHCKGVSEMDIPTNGGVQTMKMITEGDIYRLVIKSQLPQAEKFESWVFDNVLPSIRKTGSYAVPMTTGEQIQLLAQGNVELNQRVDKVEDKVRSLEDDMPLYGCEIDEVQKHVRRKGVDVLGGKNSEAYHDGSIRSKVYSDIYSQLKREYGCVSSYKSIKRKYIADIHEFIDCYELPTILEEMITDLNAQGRLT